MINNQPTYITRISIVLAMLAIIFSVPAVVRAAYDLTYLWDTGDINSRPTYPAAAYDRDQTGSSVHLLAPVQHGVRSYDTDGNVEWTYTGIANGYDIRDVVVGDLQGTGYNDTIVVIAGYQDTAGWNQIGIVDKDGNELAELKLQGVSRAYSAAIDGTDIYIATHIGVTKLVKSGGTWEEDTTNWAKNLSGPGKKVAVADMGNGKRVYVVLYGASGADLYSFETDGTEEWSANLSNYAGTFAIGDTDSSITGDELVVQYQGGVSVYDKDGNLVDAITTGTNVRTSVALYDVDGDGEEEIYFGDMGSDIYVFEHTGVNTYSQKYSLLDIGTNPVITHFDLDNDGSKEAIIGTTNGLVYVLSADLSTTLKSIDFGAGTVGGYHENNARQPNGFVFEDITGDGHEDLLFTHSDGILYAYESSGFEISDTSAPTPDPMTFASAPSNASSTAITMTATAASDADGSTPIEYLFTFTACAANGGTGGTSSSWQTSTTYTDEGLQANQCYGYAVTARDALGNTTATSSVVEVYTSANVPGSPTFLETGLDSATITNNANNNPSSSPATLFAMQILNTAPNDATWEEQYIDVDGSPSATAVWLTDAVWDNLVVQGLKSGTYYEIRAKARNNDGEETLWSSEQNTTTSESVPRNITIFGNVRLNGLRLR